MATLSPWLIKAKIPQGPGIRLILFLVSYVQQFNKRELLCNLDIAARQALGSQASSTVVIGGNLNSSILVEVRDLQIAWPFEL